MSPHDWKHDPELGVVFDYVISERWGVKVSTIRKYRHIHGIASRVGERAWELEPEPFKRGSKSPEEGPARWSWGWWRRAWQGRGGRQFAPGQRRRIMVRDMFRCRYCGAEPCDGAKLHVDHIVPWSKGGPTEDRNLVVACQECNLTKLNSDSTMPPPAFGPIGIGCRK